MNYSIINLLLDSTIALFLFLLYRPVLHGPFTFDDLAILNNVPYMRRVDPMTSPSEPPIYRSPYMAWFTLPFFRHMQLRHITSLIATRPLTNWLYEFNIHTSGLNPYHFHLTSLIVGMACTITFHHILLHFVHPIAAFMGALLLAAHPLATMSISYIAGRSSLLAGMFILLSILALLNSWLVLAVLFVVLGLLCKEEGIAAVPILLFMWFGRIGV